jgi:hypothetical protein
MRRIAAILVAVAAAAACSSLKEAVNPRSIAQTAPEPASPLTAPTQNMSGGKGDADAPYPSDFAVAVKSDGTIDFPQHTQAHVKGSAILVSGRPVITVADDGGVSGIGLKRRYKFDNHGQLLDEDGHGVVIDADGSVRGIGGDWQYRSVFAWAPDVGGAWNKSAWHTLEIVALVMLENMLPRAVRSSPTDAGAAAQSGDAKAGQGDKVIDIRIPPPSEWFK